MIHPVYACGTRNFAPHFAVVRHEATLASHPAHFALIEFTPLPPSEVTQNEGETYSSCPHKQRNHTQSSAWYGDPGVMVISASSQAPIRLATARPTCHSRGPPRTTQIDLVRHLSLNYIIATKQQ